MPVLLPGWFVWVWWHLSQAIEHWRQEVRPSTHSLARMLELIACFMAEFSEVRTTHSLTRRTPCVDGVMHAVSKTELMVFRELRRRRIGCWSAVVSLTPLPSC